MISGIVPRHLPPTCPSCGSGLSKYAVHNQHVKGWYFEEVQYQCWARLGWKGGKAPHVHDLCPKSKEAQEADKRQHLFDLEVSKVLNQFGITQEEMARWASRVQDGAYSKDRNLWALIKYREKP